MATQTFTLEGQSYTVPHGTSMDELDEYIKGQKKGPSPEVAAAANPPKAPPMKMEESPLAPSARQPHYLTREESNKGNESALSGVMLGSGGATLAAAPAAIAAKGVGGYVAPIARGLAKSYLGSEAGGYIGGKFGPTARTAGRVIGGVAGTLAPDSLLEGAPWPISKLQVPPPTEIPSAGYDAPLGPPAPTAEENLARAVKEGRAAKLPMRVPRPKEPPAPYFPGATTSSNAPGNAGPDMMARGGENWYQPPIPEDVPAVPGTSARPGATPRYGPPPPPSPFRGAQSSSPAATSNLLPPPAAAGEGPLQVATGPIPRFVTPGTKTPIPEPPSRFAGMASTRPSDVAALPQPEYPAATAPAAPPKVSYVSKFSAPESAATGVESGDLKTAADNLGRTGSAGDLAHWREDDLWQGYLKNKGTPLGDALGNEIKRRGFATSAAEHVRPIPKGKP